MGQRVGMLRQLRRVPFFPSWPFVLLLSTSLHLSRSLSFVRVSRPLPFFSPFEFIVSLSFFLFFFFPSHPRVPSIQPSRDECLRRNEKLVASNRRDLRKRLNRVAKRFKCVALVTWRCAKTRGMAFKVHAMH